VRIAGVLGPVDSERCPGASARPAGRYDDTTMSDHTETLEELAKRIASAKEFL